MNYLDFEKANCKNCYKCLRACPVKAIDAKSQQAKIIEDRCILCGHCMQVCPQNAKRVHNSTDKLLKLLKSNAKIVASVAPSFVSSFHLDSFEPMRAALVELGFSDAFETAEGAAVVTREYRKILQAKSMRNMITTACPAVNRAVQLYYPEAVEYLAPVDSPMVAHAKIIKARSKGVKVVFIGPCIAKKREADESSVVDTALTFEELAQLFEEKGITFDRTKQADTLATRSKFYPIPRGIIKSFGSLPDGYEYVAVDGIARACEVLKDISKTQGMFLEVNACEFACINGPCSLKTVTDAFAANAKVRSYANRDLTKQEAELPDIDVSQAHKRIRFETSEPTEREIKEILARTGKLKPEDELNCGACGYDTCREKAWAVAMGFAEVEMCVPFMRERAESMSYEVIKNSPNGILVCDYDMKITELNDAARRIFGGDHTDYVYECCDIAPFVAAIEGNKPIHSEKMTIERTERVVNLDVVVLDKQRLLFAVICDVTEKERDATHLNDIKRQTLAVTDEVIKKQMRVAQEIASLLGETTAETKVALLKLKETLKKE